MKEYILTKAARVIGWLAFFVICSFIVKTVTSCASYPTTQSMKDNLKHNEHAVRNPKKSR